MNDDHEAFRNELASVHKDGRRKWVYARQPSGRYYRARTVLSWFLLAFLFSAPFIQVNGQPLVLLGFLERKFVLFGLSFPPQDFYLVVVIALTVLVTLALSTTVVGRVWCGWLCPQTVFMEMLFRKIEYAIEGSAAQQLRRDRSALSLGSWARRILKHAIFFALSFVIANVFLAYIIGAEALWAIVTDPPSQHLAGLIAIIVFSLTFYAVFARFREQACTLACPYGRVMSALIDSHTLTVTYNRLRGEPRGHLRAAGEAPLGDCIDCAQCVTVCPTGIDIRNGIQLECINCTACVDACDDVMARLGREPGLVSITSNEAILTGTRHWLTARVKAYAAVWLVLMATAVTLVARRPPLDVLVLRQPGTLYVTVGDDAVANFYTLQVINRTNATHTLEYLPVSPPGAEIEALGAVYTVEPYGLIESRLLVRIPKSALTGPSMPLRLEVRSNGGPLTTIDTMFLGPAGQLRTPEGGSR
jgi:cytochrome c oxidase accessory protein FixG